MTWTSGFYKAWWGTTSPSWEVSRVSPSKSIKVTGASWKWKWKWKLRDKNQDSSSAWKSAIKNSVNNRFEGFSMLFLYGPGDWANRCHFSAWSKCHHPYWCSDFFRYCSHRLMYFSAKGGKTGVTSSLLLSPFGPRPRLFDLINHSSWPEERCVQLDVEAFLLKKIQVCMAYRPYRCCSLDPLKYFWYTVAVWVTCMSDIRACNEAAFWKIPIAAVRWLSAWLLPSSIHLASQTTTGTRAITLGNMFHSDTFFPQIVGNTICRRKTLWCDVPKMLLLAPNCCLSVHTACHGNFCLHLYYIDI